MTKEFYRTIFDDAIADAYYCIAEHIPGDARGMRHVYLPAGIAANEVIRQLPTLAASGHDTYICLSPLRTRKRNIPGSRACHWLVLDIDVRPDKPNHFHSFKEISPALSKLVSELGTKPTFTVLSGGGLQVYWRTDISAARTYREHFVQVARDVDARLTIDSGVAMNPVTLLRAPGTMNHKYDPAREVKVIQHDRHSVLNISQWERHVPYDTFAGERRSGAGIPVVPIEPFDSKLVEAGCKQIQWQLHHQPEVPYDQWLAMLNLSRFADDPNWAHKLSEKHPGYSKDEVDRKLASLQHKPTTCKHFERLAPEHCKACEFRELVKSPASLESCTQSEKLCNNFAPENLTEVVEGKIPQGFKLTAHGVFAKTLNAARKVSGTPFWIDRLARSNEHMYLVIAYTDRDSIAYTDELRAIDVLGSANKAQATVANFAPTQPKPVFDYLSACFTHMRAEHDIGRRVEYLGWDSNTSHFAAPYRVYEPRYAAGMEAQAAAGLQQYYLPRSLPRSGTWTQVLPLLVQHRQWLSLTLTLINMATPLLQRISGPNTMVLHTYGATGVGKSVTTRVMDTFWFHRSAVGASNNMTNMFLVQMLNDYGHLPIQLDEVTDTSGVSSAKQMLSLASGQTRQRLNLSGQSMHSHSRYRTLVFTNANSTFDALIGDDASSQELAAATARLMQFKRTEVIDQQLAASLAQLTEGDEGWASDDFCSWMVHGAQQRDRALSNGRVYAEALLDAFTNKGKNARLLNLLRFRRYVYTLAHTALEFALTHRWIVCRTEQDLHKIRKGITKVFEAEAKHAASVFSNPLEQLWDIISRIVTEMGDQVAHETAPGVVDRITPLGRNAGLEIVMRIESHSGASNILVLSAIFDKYCERMKIRPRAFKSELIDQNIMQAMPANRNLGAGLKLHNSSQRHRYLSINMARMEKLMSQSTRLDFQAMTQPTSPEPDAEDA